MTNDDKLVAPLDPWLGGFLAGLGAVLPPAEKDISFRTARDRVLDRLINIQLKNAIDRLSEHDALDDLDEGSSRRKMSMRAGP